MKQADTSTRFLLEKKSIRGEIVRLEKSFTTIMHQHAYPSVLHKTLGQALLAAVLLSSSIKQKGELTIQFQNDGPVKLLVAKCDNENHIRGVIRFEPDITQQQIDQGFGNGELVITVTPQDKANFYQSIVPLQHQTVLNTLEYYFNQSEQLPTKFWMLVHQNYAIGGLLQILPSADSSSLREEFWQFAEEFENTFTIEQLLQIPNDVLLKEIFPAEDIRLFETKPVCFECTCTIEKMQKAIIAMGEEEVWDILRAHREIVVTCEFCNNHYVFSQQHIEQIFAADR